MILRLIIGIVSTLTILLLGVTQLYAQNENLTRTQNENLTRTQNENLTQLIEQIAPDMEKTLCGPRLILCVSVEYEGPTMIVLNGDYLIGFTPETYTDNVPLWKSVEMLRTKGFDIDSVTIGGTGSEGNPNKYHVIMTK